MKKQIFFSESYWIEEIELSQINQFIVNEWNKEKLLKIYSETISNNLHIDTVFNNLEIIVEGASKLKSRRSFSFTKSRKYIFFIKKSTSSTPAPYFIPFFCFSWLKKKKIPGYLSSFTVKDDQGNIVSARLVNRQGQRALPILSLYANPKDVSSCDLFHRINPSQTLEIRATRFDSIPFIFPYVSVRVCSREGGRDSRLISRIENEKKGKEEGDLGKKKIWIFAVYFYTKENR